MDVIKADELQWSGPLDHRGDGIEFKHLFVGTEDAPDNYWLTLVRVRDAYHTPAHRHNFDQVRFVLDGAFGYGQQVQETGQIGYFCEGTTYEQKADGPSTTLLLQTANASRSRYLSYDELRRGNQAVQKYGHFQDGEFIAMMDGVEIRQDGYEAVWEHMTGQKISYPEPRYDRPVIMEPERFAFIPEPHADGVARKRLGSFSERNLELGLLKVEAGYQAELDGTDWGRTLFFVTEGEGAIDGHAIGLESAIRLEAEDHASLRATSDTVMFYMGMPK